jgi:hypothetical protein
MQVETFSIDRVEARRLWRQYKIHQHYEKPIDRDIQRIYQLIAQGRVVIDPVQEIIRAGVDERGFPKLAIGRADQTEVYIHMYPDGYTLMSSDRQFRQTAWDVRVEFPSGSFPTWDWRVAPKRKTDASALVPLIPIHLRPRRALANYHILWEAEWRRVIPVDPILLRRIRRTNLYLVLAQWELTAVERAVLMGRLKH